MSCVRLTKQESVTSYLCSSEVYSVGSLSNKSKSYVYVVHGQIQIML